MLPQPVLTQQGLALMAKTPIGSSLQLTGWQVGSGAMISGQDPSQATAMIQSVYSTSISSTETTDNQCEVLGQFVNTGLAAFTWEETGLFANDPDLGTILFAYGNSFGQGEPIPAGTSALREVVFGTNLIFSNAPNVTAVIDQGLVFVTLSQKGQPNGVATLDANGQVPYAQIPHLASDVTLYVDAATGDDANDGSQETPFKTIQAAVDSLPKDLGAHVATISVSGNAADASTITISGFYHGILRISGSGATTLVGFYIANCDEVKVDNFNLGGNESNIAGNAIIQATNVKLAVISKSTIDGIEKTKDGVWITGESNVTFSAVTFNNCRNAINTRAESSATRSIALVSIYECGGSGNSTALLCSTAICTEWYTPISNIGADVAVQQEFGGVLIQQNGTLYTG